MVDSFTNESFTSTSFTTPSVGTSGGFARRARRLIFPQSRFIREDEFSKKLLAKPFKILTFTKDIRLVPTLTQYKRFDYHLIGYPNKETEQKFVEFRNMPVLNKFVKIADIKLRPSNIIEEVLKLQTIKANPISLTSFSKELKATTLAGINIIRKAIRMEEKEYAGQVKLSFTFKESSKEWLQGVTKTEIREEVKELNKKEKNPKKLIKKIEKLYPAVSLLFLLKIIFDLSQNKQITTTEPIKLEEFKDDIDEEEIKDIPKRDREINFQHSSSFVGKVTFTPDLNTMEINLNGKVYGFCNVPERIFDGFEGAPSKGAYFGRNIKGQFDC